MTEEARLTEWFRQLRGRRPAYRIDTRDAVDRHFIAFALSEGLAIVTTPHGEVLATDAPYVLGVRLTQGGEKLLRRTAESLGAQPPDAPA